MMASDLLMVAVGARSEEATRLHCQLCARRNIRRKIDPNNWSRILWKHFLINGSYGLRIGRRNALHIIRVIPELEWVYFFSPHSSCQPNNKLCRALKVPLPWALKVPFTLNWPRTHLSFCIVAFSKNKWTEWSHDPFLLKTYMSFDLLYQIIPVLSSVDCRTWLVG